MLQGPRDIGTAKVVLHQDAARDCGRVVGKPEVIQIGT